MRLLLTRTALALILSVAGGSAFAYVGPGAGITMLGALWAIVLAVLVAIVSIVYWPLKSILRKRRQSQMPTVDSEDSATSDNDNQPDR